MCSQTSLLAAAAGESHLPTQSSRPIPVAAETNTDVCMAVSGGLVYGSWVCPKPAVLQESEQR